MSHDSAFAAPSGRRIARTFIVYVEDRPGTLNRVVSLFRRRGFNIDSLTVGRTEREGVSRITLVVQSDEDTARRLEANLYKLVNVLEVHDVTHAPSARCGKRRVMTHGCSPRSGRGGGSSRAGRRWPGPWGRRPPRPPRRTR